MTTSTKSFQIPTEADYQKGRINLERRAIKSVISKASYHSVRSFGLHSAEAKATSSMLKYLEKELAAEHFEIDKNFSEMREQE